jgi:hypothetical protein
LYDSIAAQAIEWKDDKPIHHNASTAPTAGSTGDSKLEAELRENEEKAARKFLELIVRKAQVTQFHVVLVSI